MLKDYVAGDFCQGVVDTLWICEIVFFPLSCVPVKLWVVWQGNAADNKSTRFLRLMMPRGRVLSRH